jgi:hypothetical protein
MKETFLRNFFQYFEECRKAKQQLSPFHLLLFLYKRLAIPCPGPAWLGVWLSLLFVYVGGLSSESGCWDIRKRIRNIIRARKRSRRRACTPGARYLHDLDRSATAPHRSEEVHEIKRYR